MALDEALTTMLVKIDVKNMLDSVLSNWLAVGLCQQGGALRLAQTGLSFCCNKTVKMKSENSTVVYFPLLCGLL